MHLTLSLILILISSWPSPEKGNSIKGTELNVHQEDRLATTFDHVYSIKENRLIIDLLAEVNATLHFRVAEDMKSPGAYDRENKIVFFRRTEDINYHVLLEELFHAYQDQVISIGNLHFDQAHTNIEFEAKLYSDIIQLKYADFLVGELHLPLIILGCSSETYIEWISTITRQHSGNPDWPETQKRYYEFLQKFAEEKTAYEGEIDLKDQPVSMFSIFDPDELILTRK